MAIVTETAASLFKLGTYAGASTRLAAMGWGAEDLSTALGATRTRDAENRLTGAFALARTLTLAGAHAAGALPLDAVHTALKDEAGLTAECEAAAADGFLGKMAIHPAQVPVINRAFTPASRGTRRGRAHRRRIRRRARCRRPVAGWENGRPAASRQRGAAHREGTGPRDLSGSAARAAAQSFTPDRSPGTA